MKPRRELSARTMVTDIRTGLSDQELMDKHKLSAQGLQSVYRKLVAAGFMREDELRERVPSFIDTADIVQSRRVPRHYPFIRVPIYDLDNLTIDSYRIKDLSEQGVQIAGLNAEVGRKKTFLIQVDEYADIMPLHFEAECRWLQAGDQNSPDISGFEITYITDDGRVELQKIIELITFQ